MSWYYAKGGNQIGPISDEQFLALTKSGEIGPETCIWLPQLEDWKRAGEVPGVFTPARTETPANSTAPVGLAGQGLGKAVTGLLLLNDVVGMAATAPAIVAGRQIIGRQRARELTAHAAMEPR